MLCSTYACRNVQKNNFQVRKKVMCAMITYNLDNSYKIRIQNQIKTFKKHDTRENNTWNSVYCLVM